MGKVQVRFKHSEKTVSAEFKPDSENCVVDVSETVDIAEARCHNIRKHMNDLLSGGFLSFRRRGSVFLFYSSFS